MLNLKNILKDPETIKEKLKKRGFDITSIDELTKLGKQRSKIMCDLENLQAHKNKLSSFIGNMKGNPDTDVKAIIAEVLSIKKDIKVIQEKEKDINDQVYKLMLHIPNTPSSKTPHGNSEEDNKVINKCHKLGRGEVTGVKPHYEIIEDLDIVDLESAVKMSGSRFVSYKGDGAKLVRALKDFMLDTHAQNGYTEYMPPVLVNRKTLVGTGQLPKFDNELFQIKNKNHWLIPTAEVPLTNIYAGKIIDVQETKSIMAYTLCFRSEAGSGGRDSKGLIRLHQFNKVELVKFVHPNNQWQEFEQLLSDAENILKKLELPYQTISLCSGDIGFSSKRTIDLEVWMPSENKYREISSVSNFGDFQARRAMIRYKDDKGKNRFITTLNGSGLAIDRCVAAILENYQNKDGTISVPKVLIPYMGKELIK